MAIIIRICSVALLLSACATEQGNGFDHYEVAPKPAENRRVELQWKLREPIPRYRGVSAGSAKDAAAVLPYARTPEASVAAASVPGAWLRILESGDRKWLVSEMASDGPPPAEMLRSEVIQRSGCLVSGIVSVGTATVFQLNCD